MSLHADTKALGAEIHRGEEILWKLQRAVSLWEDGYPADDWMLNHELRMLRIPLCSTCKGSGGSPIPDPLFPGLPSPSPCYACNGTGRQIARAIIVGIDDSLLAG